MLEEFDKYVKSYIEKHFPDFQRIDTYLQKRTWKNKNKLIWWQFNLLTHALSVNPEDQSTKYFDQFAKNLDNYIFGPTDLFDEKDPRGFLNVYGGFDFLIQDYLNIAKFILFVFPDYEAPDDIRQLGSHLFTLAMFHAHFHPEDIPYELNILIDYAIACAVNESGFNLVVIFHKGRELGRFRDLNIKRKKESFQKMQEVYKVYLNKAGQSTHFEDLSDSRKAEIISKELSLDGIHIAASTIRRYIRIGKENGVLIKQNS